MDLLYIIFTFISISLIFLFLVFSVLILRLYTGKSINNPGHFDGEKWRQQRKLASFEFSTRVLRDFSCSVFRRNAAKLVRVVSSLSIPDQVFDMQDLFMRCTLDSIFKVGFGMELNCLEGLRKEGIAFIKAFNDSNVLVFWRYVDPFWKLKRSLNIGSEASLRKNIKVIDVFVHQLIRSKRKLLEVKQFLMESEKDPEIMNDQYLRDIILNFMIAGKDTSANALPWLFYMLCKNPQMQEKVAQEVRDVFGGEVDEDNIDGFVAKITDAKLEQMHYLRAALTETLRLYPPVSVDGRCTDIDDTLPDGFKLKRGDGAYYMAYAMGRMTYIWGEDAEAGPGICLGKDFAHRQMKIVSIALLHFFRFKLADEAKNVTYRAMLTLHIDRGLPLFAVSRRAAAWKVLTF
ncbi:hypothetical protein FNV43_RR18234 [Rhamnella rubrinervis]|uniref:Cytochrome P450 n=1 Tax=Rhamnella rubrinervis TaxID=2594499 RepID=A0A8K0E0E6_9ROSA|nr:hypothetical protein FNV43_RR18234 [Rhamnella rubrinervis]